MKKSIMVSYPASTFFIYLTQEVMTILGGIGAPIVFDIAKKDDGGFHVRVFPSTSAHRRMAQILEYKEGNSQWVAVIRVSVKKMHDAGFEDLYHFGPFHADWSAFGSNDRVSFHIPTSDKLDPPKGGKRRRGPNLKLQIAEDKYSRVSRVVREINQLLDDAATEFPDVSFYLEGDEGDNDTNRITNRRLVAERVTKYAFR